MRPPWCPSSPSSSPSFSLRRISAAMSFRPPVRGGPRGRGRRSFSSDRPSAAISGDSQNNNNDNNNNSRSFGSRYSSNSSSSRGRGSNNNGGSSGGYHQVPPPQGYHQTQNTSFRPRLPFDRRPNQLPARPRPADHRLWEFAKHRPPPNAERFVVLSYNILADYLANSHRNLYFHIPRRFMSWDWRKGNILFELGLWSPDIACFQEIDKFHELEEELRRRGYSGIWKMRTGEPIDGCAVFWRISRFKLVYEECIEFNKLGMRDNVAQICVLESLIQNQTDKNVASSESSEGPKRVVVCNIHVLYNPRRGEIKLGQVRVLLERAQAVSKKWDDAPVVLCGDFNCTPKSPLYNFISEKKLDISVIGRDMVSGQASAEIRPPAMHYGHQASRGQSTGNLASPAEIGNNSVDRKPGASLDNQHAPESILKDQQMQDTLSHNPPNESLLGVAGKVGSTSLSTEEVTLEASVDVDDLSAKSLHSGHADISTDDIKSGSSQSTNKSASDTEQDPTFTSSLASTQKDIRLTMFPEEQVVIDLPTSEHSGGELPSSDASSKESEGKGPQNSTSEASDQNTSVSFENDNAVAEKLVGLSLHECDLSIEDKEDLGEDAQIFLSELKGDDGDAFPSDLGNMALDSEAVDVDNPQYDPSLWTPMEIATATGNANNTSLEHSLKLRSTYTEVEDRSGTRDSNGEPLVTSYNSRFMGTVDYIWRSEGLHTVKVLAPIPKHVMQPAGGFPTKKWGSDHIALASELAFTK